jgi:hypothetical protein
VTHPSHLDVTLRGIRIAYPEQGHTVADIAGYLTTLNDLWALCTDLQDRVDAAQPGSLNPQNAEDAADAAVMPLRELTDRLAKTLTERAAREFVQQSTAGPVERTPTTEVLDPVNALVKHLGPPRVQAVARSPHPTWMLSVALYLDEALPAASELAARLSEHSDLVAETQDARVIGQTIQRLSAELRAAAGDAALPPDTTLHLHYLSAAPALDIIAIVHSAEARTSQAMYLLAKILGDPQSVRHWLPLWLDRRMPHHGGAWGRIVGGTHPERDDLNALAESILVLASRLPGAPRETIVAGLGQPPADLI